MDWETEMEMDGDAFNNYFNNASLDIYNPPSTTNKANSLTKPETNILNTFTHDYESSASAGDVQTGYRMASLPFNHHNQGLPSTHIPPYGICDGSTPLQMPMYS